MSAVRALTQEAGRPPTRPPSLPLARGSAFGGRARRCPRPALPPALGQAAFPLGAMAPCLRNGALTLVTRMGLERIGESWEGCFVSRPGKPVCKPLASSAPRLRLRTLREFPRQESGLAHPSSWKEKGRMGGRATAGAHQDAHGAKRSPGVAGSTSVSQPSVGDAGLCFPELPQHGCPATPGQLLEASTPDVPVRRWLPTTSSFRSWLSCPLPPPGPGTGRGSPRIRSPQHADRARDNTAHRDGLCHPPQALRWGQLCT